MSEELKACPFCGINPRETGEHKPECYFRRATDSIGECDVKWNTRPLEDTLRKQLKIAVEALRQAERNLYGNPSAWITHKIIRDALSEFNRIGGTKC